MDKEEEIKTKLNEGGRKKDKITEGWRKERRERKKGCREVKVAGGKLERGGDSAEGKGEDGRKRRADKEEGKK